MADTDDKTNERIDERVYPGAPSQGADGDAEVRDGGFKASRAQVFARVLLAVSLVLVVGSGVYFAFRPSLAPETHRVGSALAAADASEDDGAGLSDTDKDEGDGTKASVEAVGDAAMADSPSGGSDASDEGAQGSSVAPSDSSGPSDPSSGQASGKPGTSSGSGSGSSDQQASSPQAPATIRVSVAVDSSSVGGPVSANATVELASSSTAYDALCATGLSVNSRNSGFGVYVAGIGGLSEFDHGGGSGWKYKVNGAFPNHSASAHELYDGDSVVWVYVTG